jgi:hypothetical protein
LLRPLRRLLHTGNPAATLDRLFTSRHVMDLQLIVAGAFLVVLLFIAVGIPVSIEDQLYSHWPAAGKIPRPSSFVHFGFAAADNFLHFFAPVLGVFAAILAWAYQTGSARLGVVDLFACEVSTLCRVAAVVNTVSRFVERFDQGAPAEQPGSLRPAHAFTSQEDYFPVFGGNIRDLQTLEARVVINITAFYTYMKAVRDSMRSLAEIPPPGARLPGRAAGAWREAARNVVYMWFLGLESGRRAIADLVEFEPEKAERTIVVLISELVAYQFLRRQYPEEGEMHHERIKLRHAEYEDIVPKLCDEVQTGKASKATTTDFGGLSHALPDASPWQPACLLLPELWVRYQAAMTEEQPMAIRQHAGRL